MGVTRLEQVAAVVRAHLHAAIAAQPVSAIRDGMAYAVDGGKGLRGFLVVEAARLNGLTGPGPVQAGAAIEALQSLKGEGQEIEIRQPPGGPRDAGAPVTAGEIWVRGPRCSRSRTQAACPVSSAEIRDVYFIWVSCGFHAHGTPAFRNAPMSAGRSRDARYARPPQSRALRRRRGFR